MKKLTFLFLILVLLAILGLGSAVEAKSSRDYYNEGNQLLREDNYALAIKSYDKAISMEPDYGPAYNNKGVCFKNLGQYDKALENYYQALNLNPGDSGIQDNIDEILNLQKNAKQTSKPVIQESESTTSNPTPPSSQITEKINKGWELVKSGKYQESLDIFNEAIQIDSKNANAWNGKGFALQDLGRYEEALTAFDNAIKIDPIFISFKGDLLFRMGRYEEAIPLLEKGIKLMGNDDDTGFKDILIEDLKKSREILKEQTLEKLKGQTSPADTMTDADGALLDRCNSVIKDNEGGRNIEGVWEVYKDTNGIPTVGIGFNLERKDAREKLMKVGADYDKVLSGAQSLTEEQVDTLYTNDLIDTLDAAKRQVSNFDELNENGKLVVMDMIFNMGETKFSGFEKMIAALEKEDYNQAAKEMVNSKWYYDVKSRGLEDVNLMRSASSE